MSGPRAPALSESLAAVAEASPLVHSITNAVTVNDVAQVTLHWGGLPVMSDDRREVAEMVAIADALLLNMGTVSAAGEETMLEAGRAANEHGVPVVFDPVGVGSTSTRTEVAERILDEVDLAAVSGNYGEVSTLAGSDAEVRGVESVGEYGDIAASAHALARDSGAVVVASGETDVVADGERVHALEVGHPLMGEVVGTGCMQGVSVATVCGGVPDRGQAALDAVLGFGLAGERAAAEEPRGPGSFHVAFRDHVANLSPGSVDDDELADRVRVVLDPDSG
jgi:hydroxyethylthiazole kinase